MAEGGNFSRTLEGGSEALFDHECTQCSTYGSRQEATDCCRECKQFLCNTCGRYHIRNMTTHTLVSVASISQSKPIQPTISSVPVVAKCHIHPDRDIEMHCGAHDMVYCCRCIAKEHRSCADVQDIEDVAHKSSMYTLQALVADITRVGTLLHASKLQRSTNIKLLQIKRANLLEEIKAVRKRFNKQLDAIEQKILEELDEEQKLLETEIGDDLKTLDVLINESDKAKPDLTSHLDERQMFITEKLGRSILGDANHFLKTSNKFIQQSLKFQPNEALCDAIEKSDSMGKIVRSELKVNNIQRSNYTVASETEINVRVESDKNVCGIIDMCQLEDGTILLFDARNKKLKRLDDQLNVKDFLNFKAVPRALCALSPTEVAVRLNDNTIHFISIGKSLSNQRKISLKLNYVEKDFDGMAYCKSQFWIPGDGAVYVYSLSGALLRTIDTDIRGRNIFPEYSPGDIAVSKDETKVYIGAGIDSVFVCNNNGDVINEFRDQRLDAPRDVCVTNDDIVIVAGYLSKNIIMFDQDGNSQGELVSSKAESMSLCYDSQKCRLLVGYSSGNVHLFQLS